MRHSFLLRGVPWLAVYALPANGQSPRHEYPVKYVCGVRANQQPPASLDAVVPGAYNTAINIRNAGDSTARFLAQLATTRPNAVPGTVTSLGSGFSLPGRHAIELDCREIMATIRHLEPNAARFQKGFVTILTSDDLDVVAVYSAGNPIVDALDVEHVKPRPGAPGLSQRCIDLVIVAIGTPQITASQHTQIRVRVGNVGSADAVNVVVRVEDQSRTTPDRIAETTITSLPGGSEVDVVLELTYPASAASLPQLLFVVDPKGLIAECDETNNTKRITP